MQINEKSQAAKKRLNNLISHFHPLSSEINIQSSSINPSLVSNQFSQYISINLEIEELLNEINILNNLNYQNVNWIEEIAQSVQQTLFKKHDFLGENKNFKPDEFNDFNFATQNITDLTSNSNSNIATNIESIGQSVGQSIEQSVGQSIEQSVGQSIATSTGATIPQIQANQAQYTVNNIPTVIKPLFLGFSICAASSLVAYLYLIFRTSNLVFEGLNNIQPYTNYIFCMWHDLLFAYPGTFGLTIHLKTRPHVWLSYPAWFMKPGHWVLKLFGEKVALGSAGHPSGIEAANEVVEYLKQGCSTVIFPDGPKGPAKKLKKGVLHMSLQSGVPIIPVRFCLDKARHIRLPTWDKKILLLPFAGEVKIILGEPIYVTKETLNEDAQKVAQALGT
eukprot:TRINITY_DN877_c0_g1_i2.p1 TRINITY_DN877_c0_g1~~TRINITY_DN877_c0_g1_i2.p1  ORF type:complete len:392 (+),score=149.79 TRINITY_DN877_c0_g1_i2:44-1219(+)